MQAKNTVQPWKEPPRPKSGNISVLVAGSIQAPEFGEEVLEKVKRIS